MPKLAAFFLFIVLSSLGLPMLNGFVGEFLILLGTFQVHWNWSAWAATGVILSACYLLWSYQRVFFGEVTVEKNRSLPDASPRERWILVTMAVITLWMGIGSPYFTRRFAAPSQNVLDQMQRQFPQEAQGCGEGFMAGGQKRCHAEVPAPFVYPESQGRRAGAEGPQRIGLAKPNVHAIVAAADFRGRLASTPTQTFAVSSQIVIPSLPAQAGKTTSPLLPFRSTQQPISPERLATRP
jgi:hypothetical protein